MLTPKAYEVALLLHEFREFTIRNSTQWLLGANHHHPIWAKIADTLEAFKLNSDLPQARRLFWECAKCSTRVDYRRLECPACASGVEEFADGIETEAHSISGIIDPTARSRARQRGQMNYRQGPNYSQWYCLRCQRKTISQYEPCDHCEKLDAGWPVGHDCAAVDRTVDGSGGGGTAPNDVIVLVEGAGGGGGGGGSSVYPVKVLNMGTPEDIENMKAAIAGFTPTGGGGGGTTIKFAECDCPVSINGDDGVCTECGGTVPQATAEPVTSYRTYDQGNLYARLSTAGGDPRKCRVCGCSDLDAERACKTATGIDCHWIQPDLCSSCLPGVRVPSGNLRADEGDVRIHYGLPHHFGAYMLARQFVKERSAADVALKIATAMVEAVAEHDSAEPASAPAQSEPPTDLKPIAEFTPEELRELLEGAVKIFKIIDEAIRSGPLFGEDLLDLIQDTVTETLEVLGEIRSQVDASGMVGEAIEAATRRCRGCGCTDVDCGACAIVTGQPCHWVEADLCSACLPGVCIPTDDPKADLVNLKRHHGSDPIAIGISRMREARKVTGLTSTVPVSSLPTLRQCQRAVGTPRPIVDPCGCDHPNSCARVDAYTTEGDEG